MGDDLLLLALFAFLYVSDSYFFLHKHSVAFREGARGYCKVVLPSSNAGNRDRALHMFSLLPPLRSLYVCSILPVSLSEKGILSYVSQTISESGRPRQSCQEIEYDKIDSIRTEGANLIINSEHFANCHLPEHAMLVAKAVDEIVTVPGRVTHQILENLISSIFDVSQVDQVVAQYRKENRLLLLLCNAMFFSIFICFPAFALWKGLEISLIVTLVLLVFLLPPLCVTFFSLHKRFSIGSKWDRIGCVVRFIICPPCSIRANDHISRSLVVKYHPIAFAFALCRKTDVLDLVRRIVRDLRNPINQDVNASLSLSIEEEWRKKLTAAVEMVTLQSGVEKSELLEVPIKTDPSILTFCPRCLAQFTASIDSCPDCLGVTPIFFRSSEETHV